MSYNISQALRLGACASVLALLASCGGSGGGGDNGGGTAPVSNSPPDSASASVGGFIAYLKVLVATQPNTIEPLDVTTFVAPKSDNSEPDTTI